MLIPIELQGTKIKRLNDELEPFTFKSLGLKESDIEDFLRENIDLLVDENESLLTVGQQVRNSVNARTDLVAVDEQGNLVLIEIKRDMEDIVHRRESFEFQAVRYAASLAKVKTIEELVANIYAPYIERTQGEKNSGLTPTEKATRLLIEFLHQNDSERTFNRKQRIILVASRFDEQTLSACAWLITNGVDIRCYNIQPVKITDGFYLEVNKELPVSVLDDYFTEINPVNTQSRKPKQGKSEKRYLPRMRELMEWELISKDATVLIKNYPGSSATVLDDKYVMHQGNKMTYNEWGKSVTGWSAMSVYEWIVVEGGTKTVHELRLEKMEEESN